MPTYELDCEEAGRHEAILPWAEDQNVTCPEHNCPAWRFPAACRTMGIIWSNPVVFDRKAGDRGAFHSKAEMQRWEAANPDKMVISTSSPEWKKHKDESREAADVAAKRGGYNDADHAKQSRKAARDKRVRNNKAPESKPRAGRK